MKADAEEVLGQQPRDFKGVIDSGLVGSTAERGATRAEDAQGTPFPSHISPSILAYED